MEFSISKIEDVRNLNNLIRLSFSEKTMIVARDIHEASAEALNAFLKNLEEPGENIYFVLTAPSPKKVLGTIVSRCQEIHLTPETAEGENKEAEAFLNMSAGQKLSLFDKIKDRDAAIKFIEGIIFFLHARREFKNMELLTKTLTGLNGNGNVNLQLTNLVVNFK